MSDERETIDVIYDLSMDAIANAIKHLPPEDAIEKVNHIVDDLLVEYEKKHNRRINGYDD